jgi:hypothetical protein
MPSYLLFQQSFIPYVANLNMQIFMMANIEKTILSIHEIIEHSDFISLSQKAGSKYGTDITSAARD